MDKYEYKIRAEEIRALSSQKKYAEAAKIADTIDWSRVKSVMMLCTVSDVYNANRRYDDAKALLEMANERHPGGRMIIYSLCELAIKMGDVLGAIEYYKNFVQIAPGDSGRFVLQYKLYEAQDVSLEERIGVLEEMKKKEYRERWAYELAYLYHRVGLATKCVEECDELILWFGEGKYVMKAMELKLLHQPLSPAQQQKFDVYMMRKQGLNVPGDSKKSAGTRGGAEQDIQVKAMDMGKYNTLNLQKELAESMKEVLQNGQTLQNGMSLQQYREQLYQEQQRLYGYGQDQGYDQAQYGYDGTQPGYDGSQYGYDPSQSGYDAGQYGYDQSQSGYGQTQYGYSQSQSGYDAGQYGYDQSQPGYDTGQYGYSQSQSGYDAGQYGYGQSQSGYDAGQYGQDPNQSGYDAGQYGYDPNQPGYDAGQYGYGPNQSSYDASQYGYGPNQSGYDAGEYGYGPNQPGYDAGQYDYGQSQSDYSQMQTGYDVGQSEYAGNQPGYGQTQYGYDQIQSGDDAGQYGYDQNQPDNGQEQYTYDQMQPGYDSEQYDYGDMQAGYGGSDQPNGTGAGDGKGWSEVTDNRAPEEILPNYDDGRRKSPAAAVPYEDNGQAAYERGRRAYGSMQVYESLRPDYEEKQQEYENRRPVEQTNAREKIKFVESMRTVDGQEPEEGMRAVLPPQSERLPAQPTSEERSDSQQPVNGEEGKRSVGESLSQEHSSVSDEKQVEKQITGQMNIEDVMKEWEKMKQVNEEKRRRQLHDRMQKETGTLLRDFDTSSREGILEKLQKEEQIPVEKRKQVSDNVISAQTKIWAAEEVNNALKRAAKAEDSSSRIPSEETMTDTEAFEGERIGGTEKRRHAPNSRSSEGRHAETIDRRSEENTREEANDRSERSRLVAADRQSELIRREEQEVYTEKKSPDADRSQLEADRRQDGSRPESSRGVSEQNEDKSVYREKEDAHWGGNRYEHEIEMPEDNYRGTGEKQPGSERRGRDADTPETILQRAERERGRGKRWEADGMPVRNGYRESDGTSAANDRQEVGKTPVRDEIREADRTPARNGRQEAGKTLVRDEIREAERAPAGDGRLDVDGASARDERWETDRMPARDGRLDVDGAPVRDSHREENGLPEEIYRQEADRRLVERDYRMPEEMRPFKSRTLQGNIYGGNMPPDGVQENIAGESISRMNVQNEIPEGNMLQESGLEEAQEGIPEENTSRQNRQEGHKQEAEGRYRRMEPGEGREKNRGLSSEEKRMFSSFVPTKGAMKRLAAALDKLSLAAYTGNLIITGDPGSDTLELAKNVIKDMRAKDRNFSGKLAKMSGPALNSGKKDPSEFIEKLSGGAMIIERAGEISRDGMQELLAALDQERWGILVILIDTKRNIRTLETENPEMEPFFNARFDIEALDNGTLVAYGCQYAKMQEYAIDELGRLALHTCIEGMQTIDHVVTVKDVRQIVNRAIDHANKKTPKHFMDVILAKRYDDDDMIILHEGDFMIE